MRRSAALYRFFTPAGWVAIAGVAAAAILAGTSLPL
jgi:hypothetical protein